MIGLSCRLTPVNDCHETRRLPKKKPKSEAQSVENARGLFNRIAGGGGAAPVTP
jgi:hypothetical protein